MTVPQDAGERVLRYPPRSLLGDHLRAAAGFGVSVTVLAVAPAGWTVGAIFGGLAGLFGAFGLRTLDRRLARVSVHAAGVEAHGLRRRHLAWDRLDQVKLRYYGPRRRESGDTGFMQLKLRGGGTALTFESNLEAFDELVGQAAEAARRNELVLDPVSAENMLAMGIDPDRRSTPERAAAGPSSGEHD